MTEAAALHSADLQLQMSKMSKMSKMPKITKERVSELPRAMTHIRLRSVAGVVAVTCRNRERLAALSWRRGRVPASWPVMDCRWCRRHWMCEFVKFYFVSHINDMFIHLYVFTTGLIKKHKY